LNQSDEHLRNMTAHHEAAHGVILYRLSGSAGPVSIILSAGNLGAPPPSKRAGICHGDNNLGGIWLAQ
jgi:hypothetical protein